MQDKKEESGLGKLLEEMIKAINNTDTDLKFPLTIDGVELPQGGGYKPGKTGEESTGQYVSIRPCGEEYGNKTYLGIYLGEIAIEFSVARMKDTNKLRFVPHYNPAIWVPDLNKIIFGCESWWGTIESPDQLHKITNEDINNVWYVQALKTLTAKEEGSK